MGNSEKSENEKRWEGMKLSSDKKLAENQTDRVGAIKELIKNESVMTLLLFDIQEDTLHVVDQDADELMQKEKRYYDERSEFRKCYESIKRHNNIIQTTAFSKVWSYRFHYDEDSSLISMYIYYNTVLGKDDSCKLSSTTDYKYLISCKDITFRGDTMNSWATTLNKFFKEYWEDYFDGSFPGEGDLLWEYLSRGENYEYGKLKKTLPLYITDFLEVVYTIGNFIPAPDGFNTGRNSILSDYWDLTLLAIYNYLTNDREHKLFKDHTPLWGLLDGNKEWLNPDEQEGIKAWNNFVVRNYIQSFVTEPINGNYGEPLPLWEEHFNLDTEGYSLPSKEQHFKQFFENARERILQRGWLIANALIENE